MNPNSMTNERLCTLAQKGDEAARELLVEKNMGFIVQTADIVYRSSSLEGSDLNIDMDDLVQEGSIGLLRAVDGFDPARKLKFLTYAAPAIKNAMFDLVHTAQMSFEHRMATVKVKDGVALSECTSMRFYPAMSGCCGLRRLLIRMRCLRRRLSSKRKTCGSFMRHWTSWSRGSRRIFCIASVSQMISSTR